MTTPQYRTKFMGMPVAFTVEPTGPGRVRAVGTATLAGLAKLGFDADIKFRVGVSDPKGVVIGVMKKLQGSKNPVASILQIALSMFNLEGK